MSCSTVVTNCSPMTWNSSRYSGGCPADGVCGSACVMSFSFFVCYGVALISRLCAPDTWLVRSRLRVSCCSGVLRYLYAGLLRSLLDAQHALAHHHDVGELHEQVKQDRGLEPAVVHAHARNQACLAVILWVDPPVPGHLTFLIPPEHPLVRFKGLDPHALLSIWT